MFSIIGGSLQSVAIIFTSLVILWTLQVAEAQPRNGSKKDSNGLKTLGMCLQKGWCEKTPGGSPILGFIPFLLISFLKFFIEGPVLDILPLPSRLWASINTMQSAFTKPIRSCLRVHLEQNVHDVVSGPV